MVGCSHGLRGCFCQAWQFSRQLAYCSIELDGLEHSATQGSGKIGFWALVEVFALAQSISSVVTARPMPIMRRNFLSMVEILYVLRCLISRGMNQGVIFS